MTALRYDPVQKALHWVVVGLVSVQFVTKLVTPATFAGVTEDGLDAWHLAVGPTILLLMVVRLAWRIVRGAPAAPTDLATPLRLASSVTHWAFYALLIVVPVLGWLSASGFNARPSLMFVTKLPLIARPDERAAEWWGAWHGSLAWLLLAVIGLHVAAAIWHGLARDDGVFARMMPGS